ncbi:MAG: hypothetical protein ABI193_15505, partial [Minicystis sp.]
MLPRPAPLVLALTLLGCGNEHPSGASSSAAPGAAPSASASVAPPVTSATGGPACKEGFRCEGNKLLRCAPGGEEPVKTCHDIERCDADKGRCEPACPEHEVYIPETGPGGFTMGK